MERMMKGTAVCPGKSDPVVRRERREQNATERYEYISL